MSVSATSKRLLARAVLVAFVSIALFVSSIMRRIRKRRFNGECSIVLIGTFYNDGWLTAHVSPLVQSRQLNRVFVVSDGPIETEARNVEFFFPTKIQKKLFGRQIARFLTLIRLGLRCNPAIYMGYHIMPNAPLALMVASLFGAKSVYQMTGGPFQVAEGGFRSENPLLRATRRPSKAQEKLMFRLVREMDAVVVRGASAKQFVLANDLSDHCFIITGAVDTRAFRPSHSRPQFDLIFVGRIQRNKGIALLIDVVDEISKHKTSFSVGLVGDGRDRSAFEAEVEARGLQNNIFFLGKSKNVATQLHKGKAFILLSASEGLSIAAVEAMAAGLPVFCQDVGDMRDLVIHRKTGLLFQHPEPPAIADCIIETLDNTDLMQKMSTAARQLIEDHYSIAAMQRRWAPELDQLLT